MDYFKKRKKEDPTLYYRFQVDKDMKVKNLFWREGISLQWYAEYGECVSFETTYMMNRYNLPFTPYVGITGRSNTCLFACAFLSDETTTTLKWVFETFLDSMGEKHPKLIIIDQDKAIKTNTRLAEMFEDTVYFSVTEDEFEMLWQKMISDFKLENNKYFNKMWNKRKIFIPVYYKNDFYPFIQSTGRSEGTNARFKDNVGPTYSLVSFLREYQRIIDVIRNKEEIDDNQSKQKMPKELYYGYTIEQQAVELYNWNIYLKFMNQLRQTESYKYKETEKAKCFELWYKSNQIKER
ncbi:protein FAR-RED IMPAIRED RESPONSE 1-like [Setaria viridis]|uniref:protein FAR-RED IMPAIRED RESPONSE 1-like n=1 Tax=Setaria viridis TaxID=4556 RepID=UPI003B3AAA9C